ncbi:hypothetical protein Pmani_018286 [Petrolisthes manimaculis]|nr:hypothetical protein Pmani_018286 [Petrolisthes manimaculis]
MEDEGGDDVRVDLPYTHLRCRGRGATRVSQEYLGGPRTDHFIRRYPEGGEGCDDEGEASTVGLSYQQRADVCTTRGHATPTFQEVSEASRRGGLLLGRAW